MKQFSITQMLLFVTWCGIAFFALGRYLTAPPYQGSFHDLQGQTFYHYGVLGMSRTKIDKEVVEDSPAWNLADSNPPVSAARALSIADRIRVKRLKDTSGRRWGLDSLDLCPLDGTNNRWCWRVTFMASPGRGDFAGQPPRFVAYILMNGEAVTSDAYGNPPSVGEPADEKAKQ